MCSLKEHRKYLDKLLANYRLACTQVKQERQHLKDAQAQVLSTQTAQEFAQSVAQTVQAQAHKRIAVVVTSCLAAVFGDDDAYTFEIKFEKKRGKTEARLLLMRNGQEHNYKSVGGGVVDVVSTALRLACLMLSKPQPRKLLVLDEPWKHLSQSYRPLVRQMVETLAMEMGVQIILVTHSDEFRIGEVVEI